MIYIYNASIVPQIRVSNTIKGVRLRDVFCNGYINRVCHV